MSASMWAAVWILVVEAAVMGGAWLMARQGGSAGALLAVQAAGLAVLLAGLALLRRWALRPARQLLAQVQALGEWRFLPQQQPAVAEWVPLARALNVLIERVQSSLRERDAAVGDLRSQLARDDLTHAASRQHFMWALERLLQTRDATGGVAILRVNDLEGLNQRLGRHRTDELLVAVATSLRAGLQARLGPEAYTLARLNGADFGLLVPGLELAAWQNLLQVLARGLQRLADDGLTDRAVTAWIGGTCCAWGDTLSQVLAQVDALVVQAVGRGEAVSVGDAGHGVRYTQVAQWRQVIENALDTGHLGLSLSPVRRPDGRVFHHHARLHLLLPDGQAIEREELMPAAVRCGRSGDLDLKAVEIALNRLSNEVLEVAVELMPQSLARPLFVRRLGDLLKAHPERARRLTLELADLRDTAELARLLRSAGELAAQTGCHLGLREFGCGRTALPLLEAVHLRHAQLGVALRAADDEGGERLRLLTEEGGAAFAQLLREWGARTGVVILEPEADDPRAAIAPGTVGGRAGG